MTPAQSGCTMANVANLGAFVQATILNPRTGQLSVYDPLVITQGTTPAGGSGGADAARHAVVTIDFGFNGTDLTQVGRHAGRAAPGQLRQRPARVDLRAGVVLQRDQLLQRRVPGRAAKAGCASRPLGVVARKTGQACPTTRNFNMVDQDPSDNVTTDRTC